MSTPYLAAENSGCTMLVVHIYINDTLMEGVNTYNTLALLGSPSLAYRANICVSQAPFVCI